MCTTSKNNLRSCEQKTAAQCADLMRNTKQWICTIFEIAGHKLNEATAIRTGWHILSPMQPHFDAGFFMTCFVVERNRGTVDPLDDPELMPTSLLTSGRQTSSSSGRLVIVL